jgi:hypothetical protein
MAKITDFGIGDKIRRRSWKEDGEFIIIRTKYFMNSNDVYVELNVEGILADDWELYDSKKRYEGWINIVKGEMLTTGNIWSSEEVAKQEERNHIRVKIQWEE